jgi:hypothetical protein
VDGTFEIGGLEGFLQVKGELTDYILHEECNTHIANNHFNKSAIDRDKSGCLKHLQKAKS